MRRVFGFNSERPSCKGSWQPNSEGKGVGLCHGIPAARGVDHGVAALGGSSVAFLLSGLVGLEIGAWWFQGPGCPDLFPSVWRGCLNCSSVRHGRYLGTWAARAMLAFGPSLTRSQYIDAIKFRFGVRFDPHEQGLRTIGKGLAGRAVGAGSVPKWRGV